MTEEKSQAAAVPASPPGGARMLANIDALDGFRGVAVLLVVASHLPLAVPSLLNRVVDGGGFGVDAFFVLSGFLITAILLRDQAQSGRVRFGAFYRRRAMRLLPALFAFLAIDLFYGWVTSLPGTHEPGSVLSIVFYYSNIYINHYPISPGVGHLWSLAVEEQFYLIWPLCLGLFFGLRRRSNTTVAILLAAIAIIGIRRGLLYAHGTSWLFLYTHLDTRADALLVGCLIAQLWVRNKLPKRGVQTLGWIALVYYLYLVRVGAHGPFLYPGGYSLIAIAVGLILVAILQTDWVVNRVLVATPLRAVGRVSYGLYIWHHPVFVAVGRYGQNWQPVVQLTVALGLSAIATYASWMLIERPFLRWKVRIDAGGRTRDEPRPRPTPKDKPKYRHTTVLP